MLQSVTNGRPGTGMMPFSKRLSEQEIEQVVDYIRAAFMLPDSGSRPQEQIETPAQQNKAADVPSQPPMPVNPHQGNHQGVPAQVATLPTAQPADMSVPFPNNLIGNIEEGRRFFMANCFTCHGVKGNGQGPRAYFNTPRPRDFTSDASRRMLNRVRLFNGIKNGKTATVMPAWGKVLTDQEIANVAEFVFQEFIQVKSGAGMPPAKKNP
jgi:mono/diheme cytochrome c family protein